MKTHLVLLTFAICMVSCHYDQPPYSKQDLENQPIPGNKIALPALNAGDVQMTDKAFGETIHLQGENQPVEQLFRVSETEMLIKDSVLIVKNLGNEQMFIAYLLPHFHYVKTFGQQGRGPFEFQFPSLIESTCKEVLFYIHERAHDQLYMVMPDFEILKADIDLPESGRLFSDKDFSQISDTKMYYVESIPKGKAVFKRQSLNDTVVHEQILNLTFSPHHRNWAAYIGDFGVNLSQNRIVFAYKYFKRIVFMDTENRQVRTLIFDKEEAQSGDALNTLGPDNVTHYWGISPQEKYVYLLYSGRTPIEVNNQLNRGQTYIYVEQFDWNGNPIARYRLDNWGYFCVDEPNETLYMTSTTSEQPFFSFKLTVD